MKKSVATFIFLYMLLGSIVAQTTPQSPPPAFPPVVDSPPEQSATTVFDCCETKLKVDNKVVDFESIVTDKLQVKNLVDPRILYQNQDVVIIRDKNKLFSLEKSKKDKLKLTEFKNFSPIDYAFEGPGFNCQIIDDTYLFTIVVRETGDRAGHRRAVKQYYYSKSGELLKSEVLDEVRCTDDYLWGHRDRNQPQFYYWEDYFVSWKGGRDNGIRLTDRNTSKVVYETPKYKEVFAGATTISHAFYFDNEEAILAVNDVTSDEIHLRILDLKNKEVVNKKIKCGKKGDRVNITNLHKTAKEIIVLYWQGQHIYTAKYDLKKDKTVITNLSEKLNLREKAKLRGTIDFIGEDQLSVQFTWSGNSEEMPKNDFASISLKKMSVEEQFSFTNEQPSKQPYFFALNVGRDYFILQARTNKNKNYTVEYFLCKM